ncbi:D-glycero-alpha-D-manno-heptose-1,7-bisphosphate 7-phosphatase [Marivirga harenae]|uniref:D-glycero-alpha-D-manno-heptose-1,7-bisphosphate 7-phosphatase n=1 Tax=Marivirga harenae TaxID=2010992 RepID=UPI0026E0971D|nr:HAD family hydrolase [Marivirga harenae]WKV10915.1 HAD family hydrolase [Marivirga harenae]
MSSNKCVFLDRDGVLNKERGDYTFQIDEFEIIDGVKDALNLLKHSGYLLIVITNQAGIAKGRYEKEDVMICHNYLQAETGGLIDDIFFSPHHPITTESLLRKPDSLMIEKAIAKWSIDPSLSYMIGDSLRDLEASEKVGVKGILVGEKEKANFTAPKAQNLLDAVKKYILSRSNVS